MSFKHKVYKLTILLIIIGCTACVNSTDLTAVLQQVNTPNKFLIYKGMENRIFRFPYLPESKYFGGIVVYVGRLYFKEEMCIRIDERALWEPNDTAITLHQHLTDNNYVTFMLDNHLLLIADGRLYWETGLTYQNIFNDNGVIIGSYSDIDYCFNTDPLGAGIHKAQITAKTTSGKVYSYNWIFSISEIP